MQQDLLIAVMPDGTLSLESAEAEGRVGKSSEILQEAFRQRFGESAGAALLFLGLSDPEAPLSPSLSFFRTFARLFVNKLLRTPDLEDLREKASVDADESEINEALLSAPPMAGAEYLSAELLGGLWLEMDRAFREAISRFPGTVADFIRTQSPNAHLVGRVFFHLVENREGELPFAFLATYSTRVSGHGASRHLPLRQALVEFQEDTDKLLALLSAVYRAAERSDFLKLLVDSGDLFHPLAWTEKEAHAFLTSVSLYEESGVLCRIPNWWRDGRRYAKVTVSVGEKLPSRVGMDAILSADLSVSIGGVPLTMEEIREIISRHEGLALIKNRWVAVDPKKLETVLSAVERLKESLDRGVMGIHEAMRFELSAGRILGPEAGEILDVSVCAGQWLSSIMKKLENPDMISVLDPGPGFCGSLRPYQQIGTNWLAFLKGLGFGACLADDMGLGKTVQILALLSGLAGDPSHGPSLLVVPASLVSNWEAEIEKFAPDLRYRVAHPQLDSAGGPPVEDQVKDLDLVITTYAMVKRLEWLSSHHWDLVIIDEAQAIKNPGSKQTRAVKGLAGRTRIAMTGTPVENRLSDLWSLFDFLNPGLLGSAHEFTKLAKGLGKDERGYARLRKVIRPYILRRKKTDRKIISDLPDKVEIKAWSQLTRTQAVLYQAVVDGLAQKLDETEGMERRGLILSVLMKLKQLCNHPSQYMGGGDYAEKDSGKFTRLREICETIREKRERVLIFSQFREISGPLSEFLAEVFGREGLVLHGGVPAKKRKDIVDRFQDAAYVPFMVLSLKAGGVGLNLTRANHVVHFDRWWNPAVENQATDRAFRIGQQKAVLVHKFVTRGTVEEKIDMMITDKTRLSDSVIAETDAAFLTEMDNKAVLDMFRLTI